MTKYHYLCILFCFFHLISILIHLYPCASNSNNVTELANEVCAKTSNYSFCVESLYSDPHTAQSDQYELANVAFDLAYSNANDTKDYIAKLLENETPTLNYHKSLQRCADEYEKAVTAIETAILDLDSESFFELAELAGIASHAAEDCQDAIKGTHQYYYSQLDFMNNALKGLCEICVVLSDLLTRGPFDVQ